MNSFLAFSELENFEEPEKKHYIRDKKQTNKNKGNTTWVFTFGKTYRK